MLYLQYSNQLTSATSLSTKTYFTLHSSIRPFLPFDTHPPPDKPPHNLFNFFQKHKYLSKPTTWTFGKSHWK